MVLRKSIFVVSLAFLSGCNSGNESSDSSTPTDSTLKQLACPASSEGIVGCWVTEECGQMNGEDGNPMEYWGNQKLLFSKEGNIQFLGQQFKNSSCSGQPNGTTEVENVVMSYVEANPEQDVSGVTADQIIITSTFGDHEPFDVGTLYHISNNYRLCLSENFTISYASVGVAQAAGTAIDFNSCLVRAE